MEAIALQTMKLSACKSANAKATLYIPAAGGKPSHNLGLAVAFLFVACVPSLNASVIAIGGIINQSIQDGTGPAVNNPGLNNIADGDAYLVNLSFTGSITSPGTYDLTGSSLSFHVAAAGAVENSFDFVSLTIAQSGSFDQVSMLACVTTGSACNQGNELDLNFVIPSTNLNSQNVAAQGIPGLLPLDLLEDDGATDIHGSVTNYSYVSASPVPEPTLFVLTACCFVAIMLKRAKWRHRN